MNEIWASRLIAGTKTWAEMPTARQAAVKALLLEKAEAGEITQKRYEEITGEGHGR